MRHWNRNARGAEPDPDINVVDRRCLELDNDFVWGGYPWVLCFFIAEFVDSTVFVYANCFQMLSLAFGAVTRDRFSVNLAFVAAPRRCPTYFLLRKNLEFLGRKPHIDGAAWLQLPVHPGRLTPQLFSVDG